MRWKSDLTSLGTIQASVGTLGRLKCPRIENDPSGDRVRGAANHPSRNLISLVTTIT
jgi:hypothetical protein